MAEHLCRQRKCRMRESARFDRKKAQRVPTYNGPTALFRIYAEKRARKVALITALPATFRLAPQHSQAPQKRHQRADGEPYGKLEFVRAAEGIARQEEPADHHNQYKQAP